MWPLVQLTGVLGDVLVTLRSLPEWLVLGVALGLACSVCVAGVFALGVWLSPTRAGRGARRDGDARRREEIRQYLGAVGEPFAEDHFVEGQHVAFYLPGRDVAITFDARAYYRIERSPTDAVLVEHEMPGVRVGDRLPFETPEIEFGAPDDRADRVDPDAAAFAVLGVPRTASPPEIKAAYREKVKEVHPDLGGDREAFERVREAYATARKAAS